MNTCLKSRNYIVSVLIFGFENNKETYWGFINNNYIIIVSSLIDLYAFNICTRFCTVSLKLWSLWLLKLVNYVVRQIMNDIVSSKYNLFRKLWKIREYVSG